MSVVFQVWWTTAGSSAGPTALVFVALYVTGSYPVEATNLKKWHGPESTGEGGAPCADLCGTVELPL